MTLRQSVVIPALAGNVKDKPKFIEQAAGIGLNAIELFWVDDEFEELCKAAVRSGMRVASMVGQSSLEEGLNDPANHDQIEEEIKASIEVAVKWSIPGIVCFSGNRIPGTSDEDAIVHTAEGLRRLAPHAEEHGVTLNLELLNSKVDHPGYQCDRTAWGLAVVEQVGSTHIKLLYDIYHMQIMEGDVIRTMLDNLGVIGHVHTAGNPGRNDLDDEQEIHYSGICRALAAAGYKGYLGHEFHPKGDPVSALHQAYKRCTG